MHRLMSPSVPLPRMASFPRHPLRTPMPLLSPSAPDSVTSSRMSSASSISLAPNPASHLTARRPATGEAPMSALKAESFAMRQVHIPLDDNPMPSPLFLESALPETPTRDGSGSLRSLIRAINDEDAFVAYTAYRDLVKHHDTPRMRKAVIQLARRLIPLLSRKLPFQHRPRLAVEHVINYTKVLKYQPYTYEWLYVLLFRESLPIAEIWNLIDQRELDVHIKIRMKENLHEPVDGQQENKLVPPLLGAACLELMLEAHLRRMFSSYAKKDPILFEEPLLYDYIERKRILLSPLMVERLMKEHARFNDAEGAKRLWTRIMLARETPSQKNSVFLLQPTDATAEHLITALTRKRGDITDLGDLHLEIVCAVSDFKTLGIKLSARIFNSILRWCGSFDMNISGTTGLDVAIPYWFNQMLNTANGEETDGSATSCTIDFATLTILFQLALHAAELANSRNDSIMSCNLSTLWNSPLPSNDMSMVPQMLSAMIELTFKALETGVVDPLPHNCPPIRVTDLVNRYTEASIKYCRSTDRIAPFVILASYHISCGNLGAAVDLLPIIRKIGIQPTSRFYSDLLMGALIAGEESVVKQVSKAMVDDGIKLNKYLYQQLIKADIKCGKLENAMRLFNALVDLDNSLMETENPQDNMGNGCQGSRSKIYDLDDTIVSDILSELGRAGQYDWLFASYFRLKNRVGGFHVGPRLVSKLLEYCSPRVLLNVSSTPIHGATVSHDVSQSGSHTESKIDLTGEPNLDSPKSNYTPSSVFYAPISPMTILNDYMSQPGSKLDKRICSAALHGVIRCKMPQSMISNLINQFRSSGMKLDPFMVVHMAEAFCHVREVEGINWCIKLLKEIEIVSRTKVMTSLWKRVWIASLDANTELLLLNGTERALAALLSLHVDEELGNMEMTRVLKAVDNILRAKGRRKDAKAVEKWAIVMRGFGGKPRAKTMRVLESKGLREKVDSVYAEDVRMRVYPEDGREECNNE
ncbi:hypothetical protein BC830DRAFT_12844 [Chytriomyces sp. MP71]|nr:hypothetical protein BC830DRAFT_12844 [Chytriomyces sp. MP71]